MQVIRIDKHLNIGMSMVDEPTPKLSFGISVGPLHSAHAGLVNDCRFYVVSGFANGLGLFCFHLHPFTFIYFPHVTYGDLLL